MIRINYVYYKYKYSVLKLYISCKENHINIYSIMYYH